MLPCICAVDEAFLRPIAQLARQGGQLAGFSCGSPVQVVLPIERRPLRYAYSLLSDPHDTGVYRIAVRLQDDSRGGSSYLCEQVRVGDRLQTGVPSNLFALNSQVRHHILVAGGSGILGTVAYATLFMGESLGPIRSMCLVMIIAGIVGLKLATPATA